MPRRRLGSAGQSRSAAPWRSGRQRPVRDRRRADGRPRSRRFDLAISRYGHVLRRSRRGPRQHPRHGAAGRPARVRVLGRASAHEHWTVTHVAPHLGLAPPTTRPAGPFQRAPSRRRPRAAFAARRPDGVGSRPPHGWSEPRLSSRTAPACLPTRRSLAPTGRGGTSLPKARDNADVAEVSSTRLGRMRPLWFARRDSRRSTTDALGHLQ